MSAIIHRIQNSSLDEQPHHYWCHYKIPRFISYDYKQFRINNETITGKIAKVKKCVIKHAVHEQKKNRKKKQTNSDKTETSWITTTLFNKENQMIAFLHQAVNFNGFCFNLHL